MLTLDTISVSFGIKKVLKNLSCTIESEDFIVIVGTNGAGKTTLFDIIAGKVQPTQGKITLNGKDITALDELKRAGLITRLFQNTKLNSVGSMTVHENLSMALYSRRHATLQSGLHAMPLEKARTLVAPLTHDVDSLLQTQMDQLSGGQRQLIAFIMSTLQIPHILLLDEPTAALDPKAATHLLHFANEFIKKNKVTTLMITHDPAIALNMGNKIWVLEDGRITKQFDSKDKISLKPENLIGQIDYEKLYQLH